MSKAAQILPRVVLLLVLLCLLLYGSRFAVQVMLSDLGYFAIQRETVTWSQPGLRPDSARIDTVQTQMSRVLALWPNHPDYLAMQARIHAWRAITEQGLDAGREMREAILWMQRSLEVRPANPYSWAQLSEYYATFKQRDPEFRVAVDKALQFGGGDIKLIRRMEALSFQSRP